jgi:hypothetical protein
MKRPSRRPAEASALRKTAQRPSRPPDNTPQQRRVNRSATLSADQLAIPGGHPTLEGRFVAILEGEYQLTPDEHNCLVANLVAIIKADFAPDPSGLPLGTRPAAVSDVNFALGRYGEDAQSYNVATHTIVVMLDRDRDPPLLAFLAALASRFSRCPPTAAISEPRERVRAFLLLLALAAHSLGDYDAVSVVDRWLTELHKPARQSRLPLMIGGLINFLATRAGGPSPKVSDAQFKRAWNSTEHLPIHKRVAATERVLADMGHELTAKTVRERAESLGLYQRKNARS